MKTYTDGLIIIAAKLGRSGKVPRGGSERNDAAAVPSVGPRQFDEAMKLARSYSADQMRIVQSGSELKDLLQAAYLAGR